jgi:hypothetical protein
MQEETITDRKTFPRLFGNSRPRRLVKFYELLWWKVYGTRYIATSFPAIATRLKTMDELSEMQIAALMMTHFEWRGAGGDDDFTHKRLMNAMFPIMWVPNNVNQYATYLTNVEKVDFWNEEAVYEYVRHALCDVGDGTYAESGKSLYENALNAKVLDYEQAMAPLPGSSRRRAPKGEILW